MKKLFALICISILGFLPCLSNAEETKSVPYKTIEPAQFAIMLQKPSKMPMVIDVREPTEYQTDGMRGAKNIPLGSIEAHMDEIPKEGKVILICRSGRRSGEAATKLIANGYTNIVNLNGGMMAWHEYLKAPGK